MRTESDKNLRASLRDAYLTRERGRVPDFEAAWSEAERRAGVGYRRRNLLAGSLAAAVAAVSFAVFWLSGDETSFVDTVELLETTSWSAPSDVLLPERQFDIYQEIPVLIESTENYEGALL